MQHGDVPLSVIIPVFNEVGTLAEVIKGLQRVANVRQIVLVDDGSDDGTQDLVSELSRQRQVAARFHGKNRGKGAALRTGLELVEHDYVLIHDADLEYDPRDIPGLAAGLALGARVVYGSRLRGDCVGMRRANYWGNRLLTLLFNRLYNRDLSDIETCYKLCSSSLLRRVGIDRARFDVDPELSAKFARCGEPIVEVPISYRGRTPSEGKKIVARDAVDAFKTLWRYRSWEPPKCCEAS